MKKGERIKMKGSGGNQYRPIIQKNKTKQKTEKGKFYKHTTPTTVHIMRR